MNKLNKAQALEVFTKNSVFIGEKDVITEETFINLFGKETAIRVKIANREKPGKYYNCYGNNGDLVCYFTLAGFLEGVNYNNLSILTEESKAAEA